MLNQFLTLGGCKTGRAKILKYYNLKAKFVILNVCPIWSDGANGEPKLLVSCYQNSLQIAAENQIQTIAFPSISTGVYGYPIMQASKIALFEVMNFLKKNNLIRQVTFVCFSSEDLCVYQSHYQK